MKKTLVGVLVSTALALGYVPAAEAAAFLSINVGGTIETCNSATLVCTHAGFTTSLNSSNISFSGLINGVQFGAGTTTGVQLTGNQPGAASAFATDTKTTMRNTAGTSRSVIVGFAENNYSLPVGNPMLFNATQGVNAITSSTAMSSGFTGYGNGANTLAVGVGSSSVTPACLTTAVNPFTNSCATTGPPNSFVRVGNFALGGEETYTLASGAEINAFGTVTAVPGTPVPEPGSMLLIGTGLVTLAAGVRRRLRKNKN